MIYSTKNNPITPTPCLWGGGKTQVQHDAGCSPVGGCFGWVRAVLWVLLAPFDLTWDL